MYQAKKVATLIPLLGALVTLGACADTGSGSACSNNVQGCPANAFSCQQSETCYTTAAACEASDECGGGDNGSNGGGGTDSCTTNVEGCEADAFSCPQAEFCYPSAAECDASGECR